MLFRMLVILSVPAKSWFKQQNEAYLTDFKTAWRMKVWMGASPDRPHSLENEWKFCSSDNVIFSPCLFFELNLTHHQPCLQTRFCKQDFLAGNCWMKRGKDVSLTHLWCLYPLFLHPHVLSNFKPSCPCSSVCGLKWDVNVQQTLYICAFKLTLFGLECWWLLQLLTCTSSLCGMWLHLLLAWLYC